jgi:hypothetical protein
VELVERRIAHEVGEPPPVGRPDRLVDQDHPVRMAPRSANRARSR